MAPVKLKWDENSGKSIEFVTKDIKLYLNGSFVSSMVTSWLEEW